jgi:hypothetical protein
VVEIVLTGGLGNQLFQYAYGRYLAEKNRADLYLNTYRLQTRKGNETFRQLELSEFAVSCKFVERKRLFGAHPFSDRLIRMNLLGKYGYEMGNPKAEIRVGHWLDRKYADAIREKLLEELVPKKTDNGHYRGLLSESKQKRVLSLHVRRGDYISNSKATSFHGVLTNDYYVRSIQKAYEILAFDEVWVFSDDPAWCKTAFPLYRTIELKDCSPVHDMFLMSNCHSQILANSTFSWWGNWLNKNPDKLTIGPSRWFSKEANPPLYKNEWIIVDT